ncbi:MAG: LexA family protein [Candidatus Ornithomonoglobus sp.]
MIRLKELRVKNNMTQRELAARIGVSQNTYSKWENEKSEMSYANLIALAQIFDVTVDYLLGRQQKRKQAYNQIKTIPIFGDVGLDKNKLIPEIIGYEPISHKLSRTGNYFGLRVTDDSLMPHIRKGDVLVVRKQGECKSGDLVVLVVEQKYITVKHIYKCKYGIILTESEGTPEFMTARDIRERRLKIIGKVVEVRGKI